MCLTLYLWSKKVYNEHCNSVYVLYLQNIVPKVEPLDSPLTDYSGENTNDTDIAVLEDSIEKKYSISPESNSNKSLCVNNERCIKKWINEVSSTQPCLNVINDKSVDPEDDKEIEIDKEVETVLQSGTIVESLSVTNENMNFISREAQIVKGIVTLYGIPVIEATSCFLKLGFICLKLNYG